MDIIKWEEKERKKENGAGRGRGNGRTDMVTRVPSEKRASVGIKSGVRGLVVCSVSPALPVLWHRATVRESAL